MWRPAGGRGGCRALPSVCVKDAHGPRYLSTHREGVTLDHEGVTLDLATFFGVVLVVCAWWRRGVYHSVGLLKGYQTLSFDFAGDVCMLRFSKMSRCVSLEGVTLDTIESYPRPVQKRQN